jgi:CRP-like cAMP-binding protein
MLGRNPDRSLSDALSRAAVFRALDPPAREKIAQSAQIRSLGPGAALWRLGDPARHVGLVVTGRLKLLRTTARSDAILDIAVPGDMLGGVAFSTGGQYQSDVVSLRRSRVALFSIARLKEILCQDPGLSQALAFDLAEQVVRLYRLVQDLNSVNVGSRLARVLIRLAERVGEPFYGGVLIPLRLRRSDLAAMAATTMESVSRKISSWQRLKWVTPQPAGYLVRDIAALHRIADVDWM